MRVVHVVVPDNIDDQAQPSGGNVYDRRVCDGLVKLGWSVHEHQVSGRWPEPSRGDRRALARRVEGIPDRSTVLVDGLIASSVPDVLVPESRRLRLVPLVHQPLGERSNDGESGVNERERAVLAAATDVITTSEWTRDRLVHLYDLALDRVYVAEPAVDEGQITQGSSSGSRLLCVGAVIPDKGFDVLLSALSTLTDLTWNCVCVGSLERDRPYVNQLHQFMDAHELPARVRFSGPLTGPELDRAYANADLLVSASRSETYGMVVAEALARGLPVVAADVGGLTEALGCDANGDRPGILVHPRDPTALAKALRDWLNRPELRAVLRRRARQRRTSLKGWQTTSAAVARVLAGSAL